MKFHTYGNELEPVEVTIEKITFTGCDSLPLRATLYLPKNGAKKIVVILNMVVNNSRLHPFSIPKDSIPYDDYIANHFLSRQIGTLFIERKKEINPRYPLATISTYAHDAENAFNYLRAQDRFRNIPIGISGSSLAGCSATLVASRNNEVAFVILESVPSADGITEREYYMTSPICDNQRVFGVLAPLMDAIEQPTFIYKEKEYPVIEFIRVMGFKAFQEIHNDIITKYSSMDSIYCQSAELLRESFKDTQFRDKINSSVFGKEIPTAQYMDTIVKYWFTPFEIEHIKWDPELYYPKITCPTLFLFGSEDINIDVKTGMKNVKKIIEKNKLTHFDINYYEGINHSFHLVEEVEDNEIRPYQILKPRDEVMKKMNEVFMDILNWVETIEL